MQRLFILLFVLFAASGIPKAQELPLDTEPAQEASGIPQTVVITAHPIRQKGAPYRFLKNFLDLYANAGNRESPDLRASLVWMDKRPDQHLVLTTEQGKQAIPVDQYGFFALPAHDDSAETRVQAEDGLGLGVRLGLKIKLPFAQDFDLRTMRRLVAQGNAIRRHLPWYMKIAQFGRTGAEYAGIRLCFSSAATGVLIDGHRLPSEDSGCVNLLIQNITGPEHGIFTFEAPPVFAELIANTKT
ncbi:hypothetical protein IM543_18925 [Massilia sp. UMI-21]|nr:hypothetical protein IM543_18925 [Massilia sp. UMI-21]